LEKSLLSAGRGLEVAEACRILSDPTDGATGLETIGHRKISANHVIQSLVIDPIEMKMWLNDGSPPHLEGRFYGYDIAKLLEGKLEDAELHEDYPCSSYSDPSLAEARRLLTLSFASYLSGKFDQALHEIRESCHYHETAESFLILGILEFKRYGIKIAAQCFEKSVALSENRLVLGPVAGLKTPENIEAKVWLARAYSEIGRDGEAERIFKELAKLPQIQGDPLFRIATLQLPIKTEFLEQYVPPYAIFMPIR
jgi:tetratricopeptide (TPR) repeat protein